MHCMRAAFILYMLYARLCWDFRFAFILELNIAPFFLQDKGALGIYCKFINVCEGFIWRISRPSLNRKNKNPANIIHVPRQLTSPKLTANINPREHGFVSKTQTLIPANINEFAVRVYYRYIGHASQVTCTGI